MEQTDLIRRPAMAPIRFWQPGWSRALNTALNSAESELLLLVLILDGTADASWTQSATLSWASTVTTSHPSWWGGTFTRSWTRSSCPSSSSISARVSGR